MSVSSTLEKLFSLHQFGVKLGLDNIKNLLDHIGHPEKQLKTFHIAGSNGKGSTASFMASMLMESGYDTGLYTSPHFVKFNERIRINGVAIPDDYIVEFVEDLWEYVETNGITFFELTTAMAFKYFADNKVDYAVIETGLGGRLDATNVLDPQASIITSISLEHTNILGEDLLSVAEEKAGIFKENKKIFTGYLPKSVRALYEEKAESGNNEIHFLDEHTVFQNGTIRVELNNRSLNLYQTPLRGDYQLSNCALAVLTLDRCIESTNDQSILNGINNVINNSGVQGRYEIYSSHPRVIFDSAHNADGIDAFLSEFSKESNNFTKSILIMGTMKDKQLDEVFPKLAENFETIYVTSIEYERAFTSNELKELAEKVSVETITLEKPEELIFDFIKTAGEECLVILGSIYLLGDIKHKLLRKMT
jgi:dihydrofolate synthase/folylpolyglutamate synthase